MCQLRVNKQTSTGQRGSWPAPAPTANTCAEWATVLTMRDFAEGDVTALIGGNRNWQAYVPPIRDGRFDVHVELRAGNKEFLDLDDRELWDLAEVLVFHSNALDLVYGVPERNIQLFPSWAVIRPFAVEGGHEKMTRERVYGLPAEGLASRYNATDVKLKMEVAYRRPPDARGAETFGRLVDPSSPILRFAA